MTYKELLQQLQQLSEDQLSKEVIVFDIFKSEGYLDIAFEDNMITFGQD